MKLFYRQRTLSVKTYTWFALGIIVLCSVLVWQRITVVREAKKIEQLKKTIAEQEKIYKYKSREVSLLSSVTRIEKIAKEKLGLEYAKIAQIRFVQEISDSVNLTNRNDFWAQIKKLTAKIPVVGENTLLAEEEKKHDL